MQPSNIPIELQNRNQWIGWGYVQKGREKPDKVPRDISTGSYLSWNHPDYWMDFKSVCNANQSRRFLDGIGFVLTDHDPFTMIDLDDCLMDGITGFARRIIHIFESYTEVSPSGKGLRIIIEGQLEAAFKPSKLPEIEIYSANRYMTVTGNIYSNGRFNGNLPIRAMQEQLDLTVVGLKAEVEKQNNGGLIPEGSRNLTLTSVAGKLRRRGADEGEIFANIYEANKQNCQPPLKEEEVRGISKSMAKYPPATTLNAPKTAKQLMSGVSFLFAGGRLYRYQSGVFKTDGERCVKKGLQDILGNKYTDKFAMEVVKYIETASHCDLDEVSVASHFICLRNGVFNTDAGTLGEHSPDYKFLSQIPVDYDEAAECPKIDDYFRTTLPRDCIDLATQLFGYCLLRDCRFSKAFMLVGTGANGKSTFIDLATAFLGKENVSTIPLQEIDDHRFKRAGLFGKLANVFADLDRRALSGTSYFKTIVAGDAIDAERKYRPDFSFRPYAKLIFSANEVPHSPDNTHAFFRRWCIIPFDNKFEGETETIRIIDKLCTPNELSGLLNRALVGLVNLLDNNGLIEPTSVLQAKSEYRKASDSAYAFLDENVDQDTGNYIKRSKLYEEYTTWCEKSGLRALSARKFNARTAEILQITPEQQRMVGWVWRDIDLTNEESM